MFRRNSARRDCLPHPVDDRLSGGGQHSASRTNLTLLVIASSLAAVSGLAAAADDVDRAGPFRSRGNFVGGYLAAVERRHRRFSRTHVDELFTKLGDDFDSDLMSVDKPPQNVTRTVSIDVCFCYSGVACKSYPSTSTRSLR